MGGVGGSWRGENLADQTSLAPSSPFINFAGVNGVGRGRDLCSIRTLPPSATFDVWFGVESEMSGFSDRPAKAAIRGIRNGLIRVEPL